MSRLLDHFDRVAIISLPERRERREQLSKNLAETGLARPEDLTWVEAVNGKQAHIPDWWTQGPGAWGCRLSQLKVLQQAREDHLSSILILEDDAVFHPRAGQWLQAFIPEVPDDWGQIFLGGEYSEEPLATESPLVLESHGVRRTHAYAVRGILFSRLISLISDIDEYKANPTWHVDHQFEVYQARGLWKTYTPAWWLAAQEEGETDIAKGSLPRRWWPWGLGFWKLPFIRVENHNASQSDFLYFAEASPSRHPFDIALWFRRAAYEAWSQGRLPACTGSEFTSAELKRHWPAGFFKLEDVNLTQLADYPANGLFPHPFSQLYQQ